MIDVHVTIATDDRLLSKCVISFADIPSFKSVQQVSGEFFISNYDVMYNESMLIIVFYEITSQIENTLIPFSSLIVEILYKITVRVQLEFYIIHFVIIYIYILYINSSQYITLSLLPLCIHLQRALRIQFILIVSGLFPKIYWCQSIQLTV